MTAETRVESVAQYVDEWSAEEFSRNVKKFQGQIRDLETMSRGGWYIPPEWRDRLKDFRFIRLGTMSDLSRRTQIEVAKALLEQQGWKQVPPGVVSQQFQTDRGLGVYLCMPMAQYREWQAVAHELALMSRKSLQAIRRKEVVDRLENDDAGPRFHIDRFEVQKITTSVADLMGETAEKARSRK